MAPRPRNKSYRDDETIATRPDDASARPGKKRWTAARMHRKTGGRFPLPSYERCDRLTMTDDLWVFGYGSLMWRPGFPHLEAVPARIKGRHRRLCVYSWVHRGTREHPGLVLGLDRGGSCLGRAFRVAAADREATIAYLRAREQVTMVYLERTVRAELQDESARDVAALTYVVDRAHPQYAGPLPRERQLAIVREAAGQSGANPDYVHATADHLEEIGVRDATLHWLSEALRVSPSGARAQAR